MAKKPGYWIGGEGPPRSTHSMGIERPFHDGAGLTSPGRWPHDKRVFPEDWGIEVLRQKLEGLLFKKMGIDKVAKVAFLFAATPSTSPFKEEWIAEGRLIMADWLDNTFGFKPRLIVAEGQPFFLRLLEGLLTAMGDADSGWVMDLEKGVAAGILHPMPRTPAIYEEQTKWRLKEVLLEEAVKEAENYVSLGSPVRAGAQGGHDAEVHGL